MRLKVKVQGARELARETAKLKKKLGLSAGEFANKAAKSVRDTVVRNAEPFGLGQKAISMGRGAIKKDLGNIFRVVPESARVRRGVITSIAEAQSFHQSKRGSRGRTRETLNKRNILNSIFKSYQRKVLKNVGMAKGSVLGGNPSEIRHNFKSWIQRWKKTGSSRRKRSIFGAIWTFRAEPAHVASDRVMGERGVKRAMRAKDRSLRNLLRREMRANLKKAEKKINR